MMYTLEDLQKKSLKELKEIGEQLNLLPDGDRRYRKNWINVIAGVNLPLLALLETSPTEDVQAQESPLESKFGHIVYPRPAQGAIVQVAKTDTGVEADRVAEPISQVAKTDTGVEVDRAQEPIPQVAKTSPGVEVDPVKPPIMETVKTVTGVEAGSVQEPIMETVEASPGREWVDTEPPDPNDYEFREEYDERYKKWAAAAIPVKPSPVAQTEPLQEPIVLEDKTPPGVERSVDYTDCPHCGAVNGLYATDEYFRWEARCRHCTYVERFPHHHPFEYTRPFEEPLDRLNYLPIRPIQSEPLSKTSPGVEVDQLPECVECFGDGYFEDESGLIKSCNCSPSPDPKFSRQNTQSAIAPAAKNLPGSRSKTSTAHQLLELFKSSAHIIEDSPGVKTEEAVCQSAIEQADKNQESDLNPILTGLSLSDRFLTRYSPPQAEVFQFQADADGQLSLLDFEVQSPSEPPDPDDFESLDAFQEALARWDAENAEMIAASMDSMCEWAPCPDEWYEPEPESLPLKASSMMELSPPAIECSITSANFTIPTFDAWCDRANRQTDTDEPPDTGIFARLPRPNPPKFPPQASQPKSAQVRRASRNYPETIPKQFSRVAAGSSTQPARSPPGGDAY